MKTKVMLLVVLCALAVSVSAQTFYTGSAVGPNVRSVKVVAKAGADLDNSGWSQPNAITKTASPAGVTTRCANALCKSAVGGNSAVSANANSMSNALLPTQVEPPIVPPNVIIHWPAKTIAKAGADLDNSGYVRPNAITHGSSPAGVTTRCANALCKSALGGSSAVSANAKSMSNRLLPTQVEPPIVPPNVIIHWPAKTK